MIDANRIIQMIFENVKNIETPKTEEEWVEFRRKTSEQKCRRHNETQGHLNEVDGYECEKCLNRGHWLESRSDGDKFFTEVMVMCKCNRVRKALRRLQESGLKHVVSDYKFDNFIATEDWQKSILQKSKQFVEDYEGKWLFMGGNSGAGKSHLCTAVAISILKKENEVKYMLWRDEAGRLKSLLNSGEYLDEIEYYKNVDVLYIDDLFKTGRTENKQTQRPTPGDINLAFEILNNRAVRKKTTIISTECTMTDLVDIDEGVAGRIKDMCGEEYCLNIGKDRAKNYRLR